MSNPAQLLVDNIRAMQSLSIQHRGMVRDRISEGSRGCLRHTHTCPRAHTACSSCRANTTTQQCHGAQGMPGVQWRATVSTWELVKQRNPNKTKNKRGNCWGGRGISFQTQSPHLRPWWMHTDLWSCAIPGRLWWPTCPILAVFLKPHHQKVKIYITSTEAKEIRRIVTG